MDGDKMTKKRFTSDVDVFSLRKIICDNKTDREYFNEIDEYDKDIEKIILVLNEQHETIHSLKIENDELKKENEQLKQEIKELRSDRNYWKTLSQSLAKTNGKR